MKIPSIIQRWGLIRTFAIASFVSIITINIVSGFVFFSFLQDRLLQREMVISAEFIQSVSIINKTEPSFRGSTDPRDKQEIEEFFHHIFDLPDVFRTTIYDIQRRIIWSNDEHIIGKIFTDNEELNLAANGVRVFNESQVNKHSKEEHHFLPENVDRFVESYFPVWDKQHQQVIGVVELYKSPIALYETLREGRILVIIVSLFSGVVLYWFLYWIVKTAHQLIENQRLRIKQASSRAVELNEQNLRRIGSELHDGPAQSIGFALLKLDSINEVTENHQVKTNFDVIDKIQVTLSDALQEIRRLSAGLVIPELQDLSAREAILKVIDKHQKRTSTEVRHQLDEIPDELKLSTKICIYRLVQEGLNNAVRHGLGVDQQVIIRLQEKQLVLEISDAGPGMSDEDLEKLNDTDHLGLRGLRERVESLGGKFQFSSLKQSPGVRILAILPLDE
ncbi:MAG: hypothetical protein HOM14_13565 [Gammaproteobacteria bacterium]|nr:hypothetical protein [Gammaproteobacteria bacterium]MBT3722761.1 hypothetical protein [Gammaproteobacteria bacterium]MBT4195393.1 hypothetical protein [Gammaproteobacteria bacterium]MBT4448097.1 hypothetical protein [Gammaproteobacteria bacterium]MBT4860413.1 hypothetical protein [Gammaproteobacteria bacterium]